MPEVFHPGEALFGREIKENWVLFPSTMSMLFIWILSHKMPGLTMLETTSGTLMKNAGVVITTLGARWGLATFLRQNIR